MLRVLPLVLALALGGIVSGIWLSADLETGLQVEPGHEVVLLSASWCGLCARARTLLERNSVAFAEYDVERTKLGWTIYASLGGGGVPILLVDGIPIHGLDVEAWAEALGSPVPFYIER